MEPFEEFLIERFFPDLELTGAVGIHNVVCIALMLYCKPSEREGVLEELINLQMHRSTFGSQQCKWRCRRRCKSIAGTFVAPGAAAELLSAAPAPCTSAPGATFEGVAGVPGEYAGWAGTPFLLLNMAPKCVPC